MNNSRRWSRVRSVLILLIIAIFSFYPTATALADEWQGGDRLSPIYSIPSTPRFEVVKIRSTLLPGVILGSHHEGILNLLQHHYTATGTLGERLEETLRRIVEDELLAAGYAIAPSVSRSIFDDQLTQTSEPGRFLIGGSITATTLNSYRFWFKTSTQEQRTIQWEILDRNNNTLVYRHETQGTANVEGLDNPASTYEAVRASFQALLTQPDFATILEQATAQEPSSPPSPSYPIKAIAPPKRSLTIEQVSGHAIPSVVWIRTPTGRGSGFLVDRSGLIVTNQHVVETHSTVNIDLYDGSTQVGRVLKRDAAYDVALLKLEGEVDIPSLPVCANNAIKVGEEVVAIGNPLSYSNTVTQGIVSSIRTVGSRTLIQTDAAINPGNSGGPLLNRSGTVIGIVTEKVASRGIEGLGFALPVGEALQKLNVIVQPPALTRLDGCGNPV